MTAVLESSMFLAQAGPQVSELLDPGNGGQGFLPQGPDRFNVFSIVSIFVFTCLVSPPSMIALAAAAALAGPSSIDAASVVIDTR